MPKHRAATNHQGVEVGCGRQAQVLYLLLVVGVCLSLLASYAFTPTSVMCQGGMGDVDKGSPAVTKPFEELNEQLGAYLYQPGWKEAWDHLTALWNHINKTFPTLLIKKEQLDGPIEDHRVKLSDHTTTGSLLDTSVIITSNLIPSHPSIAMTNATIVSLHRYLTGIPADTPIYIAIDKPIPSVWAEGDNQERLNEYIRRLRAANFAPFTNVQDVLMDRHKNLAGNVHHTLVHHVKTPYFYLLQHDMPFRRTVDHARLIEAMKTHPHVLNNVRFRLNNNPNTQNICVNYQKFVLHPEEEHGQTVLKSEVVGYPTGELKSGNGLDFFVSQHFSDNNHISTKEYYLDMMNHFLYLSSSMELYMMTAAREHCSLFGQQLYGARDDHDPFVEHLDGRLTMT